jgi:hypothetical protein
MVIGRIIKQVELEGDHILEGVLLHTYKRHNRSEMVAVLGPYEALSYYIHTYILEGVAVGGFKMSWKPCERKLRQISQDYMCPV